jgi:hypothetical protein
MKLARVSYSSLECLRKKEKYNLELVKVRILYYIILLHIFLQKGQWKEQS